MIVFEKPKLKLMYASNIVCPVLKGGTDVSKIIKTTTASYNRLILGIYCKHYIVSGM